MVTNTDPEKYLPSVFCSLEEFHHKNTMVTKEKVQLFFSIFLYNIEWFHALWDCCNDLPYLGKLIYMYTEISYVSSLLKWGLGLLIPHLF